MSVTLGKGRPTPKRSEAQKRRGGPVPPPPATRREAARRARTEQVEARRSVREGTLAGDPARMLPRDSGPVRARVRDLVDSRRNLAVLMLPVALVYVLAGLVAGDAVMAVIARVWVVTVVVVAADLLSTAVMLRRRLRSELPDEGRTRGHVFYGLLRATAMRRLRAPRPRVSPQPLLRSR